jgi:hypothetical protein
MPSGDVRKASSPSESRNRGVKNRRRLDSVDSLSNAASRSDRAFVRVLISRYLTQAADPNLEHACPLTVLLPEVARARAKIAGAAEAFLVDALKLDVPPRRRAIARKRPVKSRRGV